MPRMAAPLEAPNGCYNARTPAKLAMAGRMAGLLEPALGKQKIDQECISEPPAGGRVDDLSYCSSIR